ncbi:MAG: SRPBCC domain-containing protein [Alphaproteobacteria bacterium]|nr:SRPBCC domain-containing protein [Alphaproteobacteria bacterium]
MTGGPIHIRVSRRFTASAERVFDAWLDETTAGRWWFATPAGKMQSVKIDGRVGGKFHIVERRGDDDAEHFGTFIELDRPRRIVLDFATDAHHPPTRVTIEIAALREGGCELTLSHDIAPEWAEYKDRTNQGWTMILESLAKTLGG